MASKTTIVIMAGQGQFLKLNQIHSRNLYRLQNEIGEREKKYYIQYGSKNVTKGTLHYVNERPEGSRTFQKQDNQ